MPDLLVPLYTLPQLTALPDGVSIRPARPYESHALLDFVREHFFAKWVSEVTVALSAQPAKVLIAEEGGRCLGFACYDVTARGFFGPTGVAPNERGRGIGKHLLMHTLNQLRHAGFAYAVIGQAGPVDFYKAACGAIVIPGSEPGFFGNSIA
ncbi:GNAT family N-acetyltransferase [Sedimentitalea sp. CY04]|uniref:GNAT family N-acetyltransferase n=1 Tax=Parasedimentitalea denitrificans TaxID=2211118 RepID=A0ABX0W2Z4_9RHOB|nr:GNAT family N-acetyltransferase [Sedimentitalea sp. CY04]NIZ60010.1 GNAT family N-acetyltransferase [Sedimentitalea sp. CY04]